MYERQTTSWQLQNAIIACKLNLTISRSVGLCILLATSYPMGTGGKAREVKNAWSYISDPPARLHGVVLS
jgi:hypothetical protein